MSCRRYCFVTESGREDKHRVRQSQTWLKALNETEHSDTQNLRYADSVVAIITGHTFFGV